MNEAVASTKLILEIQNNRFTIYILEVLLCKSVVVPGTGRGCERVDCSMKYTVVLHSPSWHIV